MKDPTEEYLNAIISDLDGNITAGGKAFKPVKDIPNVKKYAYIWLENLSMSDDSCQDENIVDCILDIQIVYGGSYQKPYSTILNSVVNQVLQRLEGSFLTMTNFTITIAPYVTSSSTLTEKTTNDIILKKVISFSLQIEEK